MRGKYKHAKYLDHWPSPATALPLYTLQETAEAPAPGTWLVMVSVSSTKSTGPPFAHTHSKF